MDMTFNSVKKVQITVELDLGQAQDLGACLEAGIESGYLASESVQQLIQGLIIFQKQCEILEE